MVEILFRGKNYGAWHYGLIAENKGVYESMPQGFYISNECGSPFAYEVESKTVGQYTGQKDKNGQKIFEGDICEFAYGYMAKDGVYPREIGNVVFQLGVFGCINKKWSGFELWEIRDITVIGNIHDNPELLND